MIRTLKKGTCLNVAETSTLKRAGNIIIMIERGIAIGSQINQRIKIKGKRGAIRSIGNADNKKIPAGITIKIVFV